MTASPDEEFFDLLHGAESAVTIEDELGVNDPAAVLRAQCRAWAETVRAYRFNELPRPGAQAPPSQVKDALVEVRARLDAVESILGLVMTTRDACIAQAAELEQAADDAWDDQVQLEAERRRPRPEYQGSKERYAWWNLAIRGQRARAREARALANLLRSTCDQVRLAYDGLNETRRDLAARLTHARWEQHLEY